jgi:hypothetical protein
MARDIGAEPGTTARSHMQRRSSLSNRDAVTKWPQRLKICAAS